MIREKIRKSIADAARAIGGVGISAEFSVSSPENPAHGDYASNAAMVLAGTLKQNPMEIARRIIDAIGAHELIDRIEIARPGFINFFISNHALWDVIAEVLAHPGTWGDSNTGRGKTVVIEYFQLNIAKRPHIGHIRSAVIGDALKRMFASQGYTAVSDTHVGDWGTQFGILLLGYKEAGADLHTKEITDDPFAALEEIYLTENDRIKSDPARREMAKQEFAKLEQGDIKNGEIWQWMVDVSMQNLERSAVRLGLLPFDEHRGESFYEDQMKPIVEMALQKGVAKKTEDGAVIVDLTAENLDEAVLIKSDGASTYLLRDLATIRYRKERWNFWKNLYVVDVRQSHHFRQVFRIAQLLGLEGVDEGSTIPYGVPQNDDSQSLVQEKETSDGTTISFPNLFLSIEGVSGTAHISYGFMKLPEGGAVSTRGGTGISLEKVLDEAVDKAAAVIRQKNPNLKNADAVARAVGIGALKYFDLSHHRDSDIVFSWDRALSFEGNTGPYLQYTHARLKSILDKARVAGHLSLPDEHTPMDATEHRLGLVIARFPDAITDALAIYSPHVLAGYLYELAQTANEFYHSHPVMQEQDERKKNLRLALVTTASTTLERGLALLGIGAPGEM